MTLPADDVARRTVDGIPVKAGDVVWFAHLHLSRVNQRALTKVDLGMWWSTMTSTSIYSTGRAAFEAAIEHERQMLRKARQEARRATKAIARLTARLAHEGDRR